MLTSPTANLERLLPDLTDAELDALEVEIDRLMLVVDNGATAQSPLWAPAILAIRRERARRAT